MARPHQWVEQGKWLQELRRQCGLSRRDVELKTGKLAQQKESEAFKVSATYLRNIESGQSLPSLARIEALASVYDRNPEELVEQYGVELVRGVVLGPAAVIDAEERRFVFNVARQPQSKETYVIERRRYDELGVPAKWREPRYCFAVIGTDDDAMGEFLPPGTLIMVDLTQTTIDDATSWPKYAVRPIYLFLLDDRHVCRWAYQVGKVVTLVPYQITARQQPEHKKTADAIVCGRIVQGWRLPLEDVVTHRQIAVDRPKRDKPR